MGSREDLTFTVSALGPSTRALLDELSPYGGSKSGDAQLQRSVHLNLGICERRLQRAVSHSLRSPSPASGEMLLASRAGDPGKFTMSYMLSC